MTAHTIALQPLMISGGMFLAETRVAKQLLPESPGLIPLLVAAAAQQLRDEEVRHIDERFGVHEEA